MYVKKEFTTKEFSAACADCRIKFNINKTRELLGHMNKNATRAAAKELGWEITRESMKPCEACCVGKANKKNFSNNSDHKKSKGNDERTYIDISSVKVNKGGPLAQ